MFRFLSLGVGRQSSDLALRIAEGELEPIDAAGFSDTGDEPEEVYEWLEWLLARIAESPHPFPVYTVAAETVLSEEALRLRVSRRTGNTYLRTLIPAYVAKPDGGRALMGRRCTTEYKLRVLMKLQRRLLADRGIRTTLTRKTKDGRIIPGSPSTPVIQIIQGISWDEALRIKSAIEPWQVNEYPLVDGRITVDQCVERVFKRYGRRAPKSACKQCPFHSDEYWLDMKQNRPAEFAWTVNFDHNLRTAARLQTGSAALAGDVFLHSSLQPLDQVDFGSIPERLQLDMFGNECEGLCGV